MRAGSVILLLLVLAGASFAICQELSGSGTYYLDGNTYGANISTTPLGGGFFACIKISSSDVVLDCNGFLIDSNLTTNQRYGILVIGATNSTVLSNVTIRNCPRISRFGFPIYARNVSGLRVENATIFNTTTSGSYGIALINCSNGNIINNNISNIQSAGTGVQQAGIFLNIGSHNNLISNNVIFNINGTGSSSRYGIGSNFVTPVAGNFNNTIYNNTIWNVLGAPVYGTNSSGMVVRNNYLFGSTGPGIFLDRSENATIAENNVYNITQDCSRFDTCRNATIANNTINVCGARGMLTQQMTYSNIVNNSVSNSSTGIEMSETNYTTLRNNALHGGTSHGIFMSGRSYYDQITNNTIHNYSSHGIYLVGASSTSLFYQSIIANNTISNNTGHGMFFSNYIAYSNVFNNTISGNGQDGVNAIMSNLVNVTRCRIYNNGGKGISMSGYSASDIAVINQTYLSNNSGQAIVFEGLQFANLRLVNAIIDSPAGGLTDFANLSLNDSLSSFSSYSFNWTGTPPSPPFPAFGKFVNISILGGTVVLDAIAWHWLDSESSGRPELNFTIYKYNSTGWTKVPATLDAGANTLRATSVSPLSDFGILEGNESNCPLVTGPGSFVQVADFTGAPNSGTPVLDGTCLHITSSNVTWDCDGHAIRNNGTSGATSAILIAGQITNVTLKNCPDLSNYSYGVFAYQLNGSSISNMSISNNSNAAIRLVNSTYVNVTGVSAANNSFNSSTLGAIHLQNTSLGQFANNLLFNNSNGFILDFSNHTTISNNTVYGSARMGILINNRTAFIVGTILSGNTVFNNTAYGLYINDSNRTSLSGDRFYNNGVDLFVNHTGRQRIFNLTQVIFDSPSGIFVNYTNISLNDTSSTNLNTRFTFNWTAQPGSLPANSASFAGKFLNISISASGTIDRVAWHWLDSEIPPSSDESRFFLTRYSAGSWLASPLNQTPDTAANTLALASMTPTATSVYAILEDTAVQSCPTPFTSPGTYSLTQNATGATNSIPELMAGGMACIKIASSDVIFDCDGYNITHDGSTLFSAGIAIYGESTNVSIINCPNISSYYYGIYSNNSNGGSFGNITVFNATNSGIFLGNSSRNDLRDLRLIDNRNGLDMSESGRNNVSSLFFDGNVYGLMVYSFSGDNNFSDCELIGRANSDDQIELGDTSGNIFRNILLTTSGDTGGDGTVYTWGDIHDIFDNLTIAGAPAAGFYLDTSSNLTIQNSVIDSTDYGLYADWQSSDISLINTTISNSATNGAYLYESYGIDFTNVTISGTGGAGIYSYDSNSSITGGHLFANGPDIMVESSSYPSTLDMAGTVFDNPAGGFSDFTNLSINDALAPGESYGIFWSQNASGLPDNYTSFNNKFVNITPVVGTPSIDSLVWSWVESELGTHDESRFVLARFNGVWSDMGAALDTGANTLTLTALNSFSQFGPLENMTNETNITGQNITLYGVNITNFTLPRWEGSAFAGNFSTAPSNLTMANISASMLTDRWAAFYGNISVGNIILADDAANLVYSWIWDGSNDSIICVSTNDSVSTFEAFPGLSGDVDAAWGFDPAASDSAAYTFTGNGCTLSAGGVDISGCDYADTGYPGDFQTCLMKMAPAPAKDQLLFCTMTQDDITLWNDETGDFELLVPTPYAQGSAGFETYYFYMASAG